MLITNLKEICLYHKGNDFAHFESFETARFPADEALFKKFVFLLGRSTSSSPTVRRIFPNC